MAVAGLAGRHQPNTRRPNLGPLPTSRNYDNKPRASAPNPASQGIPEAPATPQSLRFPAPHLSELSQIFLGTLQVMNELSLVRKAIQIAGPQQHAHTRIKVGKNSSSAPIDKAAARKYLRQFYTDQQQRRNTREGPLHSRIPHRNRSTHRNTRDTCLLSDRDSKIRFSGRASNALRTFPI